MIRDIVHKMKHSPAHNYVIPGLTSWLIGTPHPAMGCVRLFTMSRYHEESIIPHSHRFDFECLVMKGRVRNRTWVECLQPKDGDPYLVSDVTYEGTLGKHKQTDVKMAYFDHYERIYNEGQTYSMKAEEFHSIYFDKGTEVLFFEGPSRLEKSQVLEPICQGSVVSLFKTESWMFQKDHV